MRSKNSQAKGTGAFVGRLSTRGGGFDTSLAGGGDDAEAAVDVGRAGAPAVPVERDDDRGRAGAADRAMNRAEVEHEPAVGGGEARVAGGVAVDRGVDWGQAGPPVGAADGRFAERGGDPLDPRPGDAEDVAVTAGDRAPCAHLPVGRGTAAVATQFTAAGHENSAEPAFVAIRGEAPGAVGGVAERGRRGVGVVARAAAVQGGEGDAADEADEDEDDRRPPADPSRLRAALAGGAGRGRREATARSVAIGRGGRADRAARGLDFRAPWAHRRRRAIRIARPRRAHYRRELGAELVEDRQVGVGPGHGSSCPWPSSIPRKVRIARVTRVRVPDGVSPSRAATSAYGSPSTIRSRIASR